MNVIITITIDVFFSDGGSSAAYLMEVEVEIISRQQCTAPEWRYTPSEIGPETICAGLPEGGKDSCQVCHVG